MASGQRTSRIVSAPRSSYAHSEHRAGNACPQRHLGQAGSSQNRLSTREQPYGHGATRIVSDGDLAGSGRRCRPGSKRSKSRPRLLKRLSLADAHPAPRRSLRQQSLALAALLAALRVEIASIHECSESVQLPDPPTQNEGPFGPSSTPQRRSQQIDQRLSLVALPHNAVSRRGVRAARPRAVVLLGVVLSRPWMNCLICCRSSAAVAACPSGSLSGRCCSSECNRVA